MGERVANRQRTIVEAALGNSPDFECQLLTLGGIQLEIFALSSLADLAATVRRLLEVAPNESCSWENLRQLIGSEKAKPDEDLVRGILGGRALILAQDGSGAAWIQPEPRKLERSVGTPHDQNILTASKKAFIEDIATNLGLIRRELQSPCLRQAHLSVGSSKKKRVILLSMEDTVESGFAAACEAALRSHEHENLASIRQVAGWLRSRPAWSPIASYVKTESPHEAAYFLQKGRIVLLIEEYPEALVVPAHLLDLFISAADRDYPASLAAMVVFFRMLGALVAVAAPAAYVALVSVNPDVLKLELIYSIARSRVGVPYPSIMEALILLFIIEMLLEAIIRLPKSIGPAMTMVGGIILGQAVVEARLVSNLLIIVLAASTIANFAIIGYHFALAVRLWRYILLFLAALFGPLGMICGFYLLLSLISAVSVMGKPLFFLNPARGKARMK